jgi:hypothetical protein
LEHPFDAVIGVRLVSALQTGPDLAAKVSAKPGVCFRDPCHGRYDGLANRDSCTFVVRTCVSVAASPSRRGRQVRGDRSAFVAEIGPIGKLQLGVECGDAVAEHSSSLVVDQLQPTLDDDFGAHEGARWHVGVWARQEYVEVMEAPHRRQHECCAFASDEPQSPRLRMKVHDGVI